MVEGCYARASRLVAGQAICSRWDGMGWDASGSGRGSSSERARCKLAVAVKSDLDSNQLARRWVAGRCLVWCVSSRRVVVGCIALQTWGLEGRRRTGQADTACSAVRRGARG